MLSYNGNVCFGLSADRNLNPPVRGAIAALDAAIEQFTTIAGERGT